MRTGKLFLAVAVVVTVAGLGGWAFQLSNGLAVTNMSNMFNWGLYIALFAFLVGTAAGGMIISSSIYLFRVEKLKAFGKIASLSAFACACGAGAMVLVDLGSIQNILNLFVHPNFRSPLVWDVIVIACYIVLTFLSVRFQLMPDCKREGTWFFNGSIKKKSVEETDAHSEKWSRRIALVALPFAIAIHTVTALIFATQSAREWWSTAVLPPDFIAMAVASGGALVLILGMAFSGKESFQENLDGYRIICKIVATALAVHFFFTAMELILAVWNGGSANAQTLGALFGTYGALYAIEIALPAIAMVMFFTKKGTATRGAQIAGSALVLVGTLAHRLMLLYPAFSESTVGFDVLTSGGIAHWLYPVSTGRVADGMSFATAYAYVPTGMELLVSLLPLGLMLVILAVMVNRYPIMNK